MANAMIWATLVAYVFALAGCAAPSRARVRLAVPLVRQGEEREGGLASARMITRFYKCPLPERTERLLRLASASGDLSAGELKAALESSGLTVTVFTGTLDRGPGSLYAHLDRGEPVLVRVGASYMLVDGYGGDHVHLLDPRRGALEAEAGDFDRAWRDGERLALAASR